MTRLVMSSDDSQKRGGNRQFERLFYLHIALLVIMTACTLTVWIVMRRTQIESLVLAESWAESHHQLVREANINRLSFHHRITQDAETKEKILNRAKRDLELFEKAHTKMKLNNRIFTDEVSGIIESWIERSREAFNQHTTLIEESDGASDVKPFLWGAVKWYNEKIRNSINYRADIIGMVFLAISTFLVIVLMFLVRAEYLQQQATILLAEELASVIHDVRTPQQIIMSAIALLAQPNMNAADTAELIQVVSDSCSATQRLLDTALLRIRARGVPEPIPLPGLFKSVSNIQSVACRDKGIEWYFEIAKAAQISAIFDRDSVLQIVNNIVSNAIRYTDTGAVSLTVDLLTSKAAFAWCQNPMSLDQMLVITVTDSGRGIPRQSMASIFQKFQQVKSGTGFGIGLFTVARLVNSANGCIDLWSEPGKGTKFVVSIPIRVIAPVAPVAADDDSTAESGTCASRQTSGGKATAVRLSIALLDDDAITTKLSKRILTCAGHGVVVFTNGGDLLEKFHGADVIVSDVNMPGSMTGMEVASRLRTAGYQGALIAHTGDNFAYDSCIESGFDAVLAKPTSASVYIETVESVYLKRKALLEKRPFQDPDDGLGRKLQCNV